MQPTLAPPVSAAVPAMADHEVDRHAAGSIAWQIGKVVVQMVQYVALARLVLPADYGKYALAAPLFTLLGVINDGGLSTATVTSRRYDAALASSLAWTQIAGGAIVAFLMALLSPVLAWMFEVRELATVGLWLGAVLFIGAWGLQPRARLRRDMRVGALAMIDIAGALSGLAVAWIMSFFITGVEILLAGMIATALVGTIVATSLAPVRLHGWRMDRNYRRALQIGWRLLGSDLMNALLMQSPAFIIGFFVFLSDVGFFNRANQLLHLPLMVLGPAIVNFLLPLLARSVEHPEQFRRNFRRSLRLFLTAAVPGSVWIALGPTEAIVWALGEEWGPVVPVLRYLSPAFAVQIVCTVTIVALLSRERAQIVRAFTFWNLVLTVLVCLAAAPFGVEVVALALSLAGLALSAPLLVYFATRDGSVQLVDVLEGVRFMLALAAGSAALLWLCRLVPVHGVIGDLIGLLAVGAVSAGVLYRTMGRASEEVFA